MTTSVLAQSGLHRSYLLSQAPQLYPEMEGNNFKSYMYKDVARPKVLVSSV